MKKLTFLVVFLAFLALATEIEAQVKRRSTPVKRAVASAQTPRENSNATVIVVDERLAVLRAQPSLYAAPLQRIRRGRQILVSGWREADGVRFYRVNLSAEGGGWVQSDAVIRKSQRGDDERLAKLIQASTGFDQIERARIFLDNFPNSRLRPAILLLFGDIAEEMSATLSREALRRLDKREMNGSSAPVHSFYLNYTSLDRYRKLGINFLFNSATKTFHYDGATWREILTKFPNVSETVEAQKRLDSLKEKLERKQ